MDMDLIPTGRRIAEKWWGKSWVTNLESYADYSNRLPRGKTYLRNGAVRSMDIDRGLIRASVQGSRPKPYKVSVEISPLPEAEKKALAERCGNRIQSLDALIDGDIPQDIADVFVSRNGLFPSPREIKFRCSCPDYAYMCKHVAATLYGVGVLFDREPLLFFRLRGIDVDTLVKKSVERRFESMMKNADNKTSRMLDDDCLDIFGVLE
jgi:uncharacterized Zn finger protein